MNWKRECTWLQPPPVILSLPSLAQGCAIVCVMWDTFSRKAWETCATTHTRPGEAELSQSGAVLLSQPCSKQVSPPTDHLGSVVLRSCALGIAASLQPPQTSAGLARDFGHPPFACLTGSSVLVPGVFAPLTAYFSVSKWGTEERACLYQQSSPMSLVFYVQGGHRKLKALT